MKALAEQQAENEALKEERMHSLANDEEHMKLRVQHLEQQLQQMTREQDVRSLMCHTLSIYIYTYIYISIHIYIHIYMLKRVRGLCCIFKHSVLLLDTCMHI